MPNSVRHLTSKAIHLASQCYVFVRILACANVLWDAEINSA